MKQVFGEDFVNLLNNNSAMENISKNLEQVLNDSLNKSKEANFEMLLQEIRNEAAKNGLTEEILMQLLNEEE